MYKPELQIFTLCELNVIHFWTHFGHGPVVLNSQKKKNRKRATRL